MTELNWEGKYKDDRKVTPVRIALPFQTIETINESSTDREKRLGMLPFLAASDDADKATPLADAAAGTFGLIYRVLATRAPRGSTILPKNPKPFSNA